MDRDVNSLRLFAIPKPTGFRLGFDRLVGCESPWLAVDADASGHFGPGEDRVVDRRMGHIGLPQIRVGKVALGEGRVAKIDGRQTGIAKVAFRQVAKA